MTLSDRKYKDRFQKIRQFLDQDDRVGSKARRKDRHVYDRTVSSWINFEYAGNAVFQSLALTQIQLKINIHIKCTKYKALFMHCGSYIVVTRSVFVHFLLHSSSTDF